jgi:transcription antitermination factor NusG
MDWHIALAEPGQDTRAEKSLLNNGYLVYRPIMPAIRRSGYGRCTHSSKSMYPGYLLTKDDCSQGWRPLQRASGIRMHGPLMTRNGRFVTLSDDSEAFKLIKHVEAECWLKTPPEEPQIAVGDQVFVPVELNDGTIMELLGTIERLDETMRVSILVHILRQTIRLTITRERLLQHMATGRRVPSGDHLTAA